MAKRTQKPVTVDWARKTLNKWGFHVRDQGDKLMCLHTTKMFDAVIAVDDGVADLARMDQLIDALRGGGYRPLLSATGGFASSPEMSLPVTIQER